MILFWLSTLSSLVTIVLWLKNEWLFTKEKRVRFLYPLIFIILSFTSVKLYNDISEMTKIENEASEISKDWPEIDHITYLTKGQRLGIIMAGQIFLEKNKSQFPDTYQTFQDIKKGRLGDYKPKNRTESIDETDNLEDVCGATITTIRNLAKK